MKLEISEIIAHVGRHATVEIEAPCDAELGMSGGEPIRGRLALSNTGRHLLVRGELSCRLCFQCARCLKDVWLTVSAHIEEEFALPQVDARGRVTWHLEDEPVESLFEDYALDVSEMARQHLLAAAPTAPLCDEECRGLCPQCGADLNEGDCGCTPVKVDPRLAGLRRWLDEKER
ncbi:MAG: DUF177 domain-containing protein [Armatimonadota bacterium]|nr:DUF177 domain-containing protein [Armatimonadota bacterium]